MKMVATAHFPFLLCDLGEDIYKKTKATTYIIIKVKSF